jgi:hypothetical protein
VQPIIRIDNRETGGNVGFNFATIGLPVVALCGILQLA